MKKEPKTCLSCKEAYNYYFKNGELPLHLPDNFEIWAENMLKNKHSENYINERIELVKYLYCELADSYILRKYSCNKSLVKSSSVPYDVENEAIRIIKEAEELLDKLRDVDEYYLEGNHRMENQHILSEYKTYLSAVYQIPEAIMKNKAPRAKKEWKFW